MICDKITYGGQRILTLYHTSFDDVPARRITEKIGRYNLIFEEFPCHEMEIPEGWAAKESGLLPKGAAVNPYGSGACAYAEYYVFPDKPGRLFRRQEGKSAYALRMDPAQLEQINAFVEKYTGLSLAKHPMYYGDVFCYELRPMEYRAIQEKGVAVENVPANATVIVRFQKNGMVVSSQILHTGQSPQNVEVLSDTPWSTHDIEVYADGKLLYSARDVSYARRLALTTQIAGGERRVPLKKLAKEYRFREKGSAETVWLGLSEDALARMLLESNASVTKELAPLRKGTEDSADAFTLICPGEGEKALGIIMEQLLSATGTVWIFDPYFTDQSHRAEMMDWLHLMTRCPTQKHVVFQCDLDAKNRYNAAQLREEIEKDHRCRAECRTSGGLGIVFHQLKDGKLHDRFILTESDGHLSGIVIGTSLNSIDDHFFCIYHLGEREATAVWDTLKPWLEQEGTIEAEEAL